MTKHRIAVKPAALAVAAAIALAAFPLASSADDDSQSQIQRGYQINPVTLNLAGKNRALVGLGSYIVNSGGCNDCHTSPSYAPGGNPFLGEPEQVNTAVFLAGGQHFGPFVVSLNLTPDAQGRPAGLTFDEFRTLLRTGHDPDAPAGQLLQVMPWPAFGKKTDHDLRAIYEYLRAIPSLPDNY
ncbi:MAG: cytochrome C [Candidatus Levyibacteriota bacterium]